MASDLLSKTDNHILRLLKILLSACLAVPLLASAAFIFPYTVPKVFAFRILVEIAAALYFYLALKYPAYFLPTLKKGGWGGFLNLSVLIFLAISFLSAIFGADFYTSWWGNLERGMGVWSLAHFVVWFLMLAAVFRKQKDWQWLIKLSVAVSVIAAVTAIIQRFGGLGELLPSTGRIYGVIGNAGVLGSYLIFNVFLAGYLVLSEFAILREREDRKIYFFGYCFLFLVSLLALALTGTRGAYLGLLAGAIVFLSLPIFRPTSAVIPAKAPRKCGEGLDPGSSAGMTNKKKRLVFILLMVIFILIGSLFLFRSISLGNATAQSRLILWQDSWQAWQAKPLLGFGPENFETGIGKYLSPRLAEVEVYATDRAHNFIFDYGVATGWLGLLGYLSAVGAAVWLLWRTEKTNFIFSAVFISLLAAYLVQNFFIFDSFVSYLMLFFVLGTVNNVCHLEPPTGSEESARLFKKLIFLFVIGYSLFAIYSYNFKPLLAAYRANQILSLPASEALQAAPLLKDALALNSFASPEIVYQVVLDYIDKISQNQALAQNEEFYAVAAGGLSNIIEHSPSRARNYIALAWLNLYFSASSPQRINNAADLGNKIKDLSPIKKDAYLILVAAYSLSGQNDRAQEIISQAAAVDGKMGEEVREYYGKLK